jgi:outer membrane lipoprotein-sorting protein
MFVLVALLALSQAKLSAPKSAEDYLKAYDAVMGPKNFESVSVMIAHRDDDTTRTYQMKILKNGDDKLRLYFNAPASAKGQEMLRQGDNLWVYMPSIKKAIRLASRDSFQGGDFNNADILRSNLAVDYSVKFSEEEKAPDAQIVLDLVSKTPDTSYDKIRLWIDTKSALPVKGQYFAASGKLLRSATFTEVKEFHGVRRPARITMRNELATKRYSELATVDMAINVNPPSTKFVLDDLGR